MTQLTLISCNSDGSMLFRYGEHTLTTNVTEMYKWDINIPKDELTREIKKDINIKLEEYKKTIDKGVQRVRSERTRK